MYIIECRQLKLVDGELVYEWDEWRKCLEKESAERFLQKYQSISRQPFRIIHKPDWIMTKTYKLPMSLEDWQCYLDTPQEVVDLINTNCQQALERSKDPKSALFNGLSHAIYSTRIASDTYLLMRLALTQVARTKGFFEISSSGYLSLKPSDLFRRTPS